MLQKFKITTCAFILCLFALTPMTVSAVSAEQRSRDGNQIDAGESGDASRNVRPRKNMACDAWNDLPRRPDLEWPVLEWNGIGHTELILALDTLCGAQTEGAFSNGDASRLLRPRKMVCDAWKDGPVSPDNKGEVEMPSLTWNKTPEIELQIALDALCGT